MSLILYGRSTEQTEDSLIDQQSDSLVSDELAQYTINIFGTEVVDQRDETWSYRLSLQTEPPDLTSIGLSIIEGEPVGLVLHKLCEFSVVAHLQRNQARIEALEQGDEWSLLHEASAWMSQVQQYCRQPDSTEPGVILRFQSPITTRPVQFVNWATGWDRPSELQGRAHWSISQKAIVDTIMESDRSRPFPSMAFMKMLRPLIYDESVIQFDFSYIPHGPKIEILVEQ